jgi:hypothetical protein
MASALPFRIIRCEEWKAKPPKGTIVGLGRPERSIFHHTAGHVPNISKGETYAEACAYARAIQNYHMRGNGWIDSGHNFLVTRGGYILEGRHGTVSALLAGRMVDSAHCPGQNDQPGVEHEHIGSEKLTPIEREASVWLHAWIARHTAMSPATMMQPHQRFFPTACPGSLTAEIPVLRAMLVKELKPLPKQAKWFDKYGPAQKPDWLWPLLREYQRRLEE